MITSISAAGVERKLILNESLILVEKDDVLTFRLNTDSEEFKLVFRFSDTGKEYDTSGKEFPDERIFDITLHKWEGKNFIELTRPWDFEFMERKYWAIWRSFLHEKGGQRVFELSVWTSNN